MPAALGDLADVVFRVGRAYGMTADRGVYRAVAVKDGRIAAVGRSRDELDTFIGPGTAVIDDPELVLYPAFTDTHNHQLLAARDLDYVSLEQARSIDELVQALREAAATTPPGGWIISSRCWHETHLREGRLPAGIDPEGAARVCASIFEGLVLQQAWNPQLDVDAYIGAVFALIDGLVRPKP